MQNFTSILVLKVIIFATSASAQITPQEVIDLWHSDFKRLGATLSFDQTPIENDAIAISNFKFSAGFGIEDEFGFLFEGTANDVILAPTNDGAVSVKGLNEITARITITENSQTDMDMRFTVATINPEMIFSKNGTVITRSESYDSMIVTGMSDIAPSYTNSLLQSPTQVVGPFMFTMDNIAYESHRDMANGPYRIYGTNTIEEIKSIQGQESSDFSIATKTTINGQKANWSIDFNDGQDWLMLAATFIGSIIAQPTLADNNLYATAFLTRMTDAMRGDEFEINFNVKTDKTAAQYMIGDDVAMGEVKVTYSSETSLKMNDTALSFEANANDLFATGNLNALTQSGPLPFPIPAKVEAAAKQVHMAFELPLSPIGQEVSANTSFAIRDITLADEIWDIFDPTASLARDPISLEYQIGANMVYKEAHLDYLFGIFENLTQANYNPNYTPPLPKIDLPSLYAQVKLKALGAEISADGLLSPNLDEQMQNPNPTGNATVWINNFSPTIRSLVKAGLVDPQMAMAAMGAMAMFVSPDPENGPQAQVSQIELKSGGSIFVNGMQIQ